MCVIKILSKYKWSVVFILVLLVVQAFLDLSLPMYTSKIVDVGIAQSGIESNVPDKIRESELIKIKELSSDKDIIEDSYKCKNEVCELINYSDKLSETFRESQLIILDNDEDKLIDYVKNEYVSLGIDINDYSLKYIVNTGLKMLLLACCTLMLTFLSVYMSSKVMANFGRDLRVNLLKKIVSFESEEIGKFSSASLITRCTNDVMQVSTLVMVFLRIVIYAPILGIGALVKVNTSGVSYLVAVPVILILIVMVILFTLVVPKMKVFQDKLDKLTVVSKEILSGIPVIRAFTNERKEEDRFNKESINISNTSLFIDRSIALLNPTLTFIINSVSIFIVWICAYKINDGIMGVGEMIAIGTYVIQISMAFLMISMVAMMIPRSLVSIKRISEVLNTNVSVCDLGRVENLNNINSIEFKDVSFKYTDSSLNILENISFKVNKGESVGIIGSTGSGKTTLVNLISRFYDVSSGEILVNRNNIRNYKIKDLRECVSYVPQKSWLKSGTIKSNICFGEGNGMEEAARISMAEDFILSKEGQYNSLISEGGNNVSGGQRQRLSIARALYKKANVLILDDSMSALDYKTEASIRNELNKIKKDKIIFVVAQRVASVMHLDKIIVLDNGKIVGIGTDKELVKSSKVYKEIRESQLGGVSDGSEGSSK